VGGLANCLRLLKKYCWWLFGASRDLGKVMAHNKEKDEKVKWYATVILNTNGENNLVWQLKESTGWKNHTRVYREIERPINEPYL
jgi:hypothetical protein